MLYSPCTFAVMITTLDTTTTLEQIRQTRSTSAASVLQLFDELEPVSLEFMLGRWKGFEIATGHRMDGLLVATGWYGKFFKSPEEVHPLLFYTLNHKSLYAVNPKLIPLGIPFPKSKLLAYCMTLLRPILQTRRSAARIRLIAYRGKVTGTMAYDKKAIFDHFVRIDDNTMLGIMDLKGVPEPYCFVLERDNESDYNLML